MYIHDNYLVHQLVSGRGYPLVYRHQKMLYKGGSGFIQAIVTDARALHIPATCRLAY